MAESDQKHHYVLLIKTQFILIIMIIILVSISLGSWLNNLLHILEMHGFRITTKQTEAFNATRAIAVQQINYQ